MTSKPSPQAHRAPAHNAPTGQLPLEFYKVIVEHMKEGLWVGDEDHRTLYVNPSFERIFGYSKSDWLGKYSYTYFDEKNRKIVSDQNEDRTKGKPSVYEVEVLKSGGGSVPVLMSGAPLPDGGTVGIMADLKELKETQKRYQQLIESMNEGVWVGDAHNRTIYANPAFLAMLGYTLDEVLGQEQSFFLNEEANSIVAKESLKRKKNEKSHYEVFYRSKSGELIPVLIHAVPFVEGSLATVTDLRSIKHLQRREQEFQLFAQYSADAMVSLDKDDIVRAWNVGAERMFGWKDSEMLGKKLDIIIPQDKIEAAESDYLLKEANAKGFVRNHETVRLHKNGTPIDVSLTYTALKDAQGRRLGYSSVYRDITLQKSWQQDLEQRFEKMQSAYNEMGKLRRYVDYMVDLLDLGIAPTPHTDLGQFIVTAMLMFSHADGVVLRGYDGKTNKLHLAATAGTVHDWTNKGPVAFKGSLAERAFREQKPLKILDVTQEPLYRTPGFARKNNLRSLLLIPLSVQEKKMGTLSVYISGQKSLDTLDHEFLPLFAKLSALVLNTHSSTFPFF